MSEAYNLDLSNFRTSPENFKLNFFLNSNLITSFHQIRSFQWFINTLFHFLTAFFLMVAICLLPFAYQLYLGSFKIFWLRWGVFVQSLTLKHDWVYPVTAAEKAMAAQSSTLAWKIPWVEEPGRLQSMGSWRVGHDWATSLSLFTFMHWRRKWQPTPVFLPGESQGWGSLVGCRLWGCTESDTTEVTWQQQQ